MLTLHSKAGKKLSKLHLDGRGFKLSTKTEYSKARIFVDINPVTFRRILGGVGTE